ncbi:MAG: tRNA glutamyl-Q(34) synthetase GluQRS [Myxococcota bacterium]
MTEAYRTRLAPSPTGDLHLGHARTSLVAWLRARTLGGSLVMRIEDLDGPRVREGATEAICADLRWLGIDWDEGPDVGGARGPYVQSQRVPFYEEALEELARKGFIYACTCTRREIRAIASAPHGEETPRYPGLCRRGPTHPGRPASLRFRMQEPSPGFRDVVHGRIGAGLVGGDFVVRRSDGLFAYQLAVVVDDAAMGVTEVVRGDDLLTSTPRQIALYRALGRPEPAWLHVPLVLGPDGKRLSKRHGAVSIAGYREAGWSAERVVGMLAASLGLVRRGAEADPAALLPSFDPERLPREPATLDPPVPVA